MTDYTVGALKIQLAFGAALNVTAWCLAVVVVWLGLHRALAGEMAFGTVVAFSYLLVLIVNNGSALVAALAAAASAAGKISRLLQIISSKGDVKEIGHWKPFTGTRNRGGRPVGLAFSGVKYRYSGRRDYAIQGLDLEIRSGERVALVGASAAGKSTILELVLGLIRPVEGEIRVDGVDLGEIPRRQWRRSIGYVPQDGQLMSGTIAQNIAYGYSDASPEEIRLAAKAVGVEGFIATLPDGYETDVGDLGEALSGGQRQRIALARALMVKPRLLVLDEPTAALDADSEEAVERALRQIEGKVTILVVCHRVRNAIDSDKVLVLDQGVIVDEGDHENLTLRSNVYRAVMGVARRGCGVER